MDLSIAIADAGAPPNAFVVWRGFDDSIRKAAACGYRGVELALKTAGDVDAEKLARLLDLEHLAVSAISTGQVFACLGLCFTHPDHAVRGRAVQVFEELIALAGRFGRTVNIGRARGGIADGQTRAQAEGNFVECMRRLCDCAAPRGVTLVIEPVNRYEINFINTVDEGAALLAAVARPNAGLMPDVFHMNIEDARIGDTLVRHAPLVKYLHLADSNRLAPGRGHLDFEAVFAALKAARYNGWAAVEILPTPDPDTAAREATAFLAPLLHAYNNE
ncbi:sugar phosphate isomerase/epimerase [bacterium]|nr:sugar phosphate isomerase/epimerase [bacterium]